MVPSADYPAALASLPLRTADEAFGSDAILVIAPHPDDESLGCGGLLAWAAKTGRRADVLFLTDGEGSHPGSVVFPPMQLAQIRIREAMAATALLGIPAGSVDFLHLPDGSLPGMPDSTFARVKEGLRVVMQKLAPCVVCVTAPADPHGDHQRAYELAAAAVAGLPGCRLLCYPIWSWTTPAGVEMPQPQGFRVDIASEIEAKSKAIAAHASQHGRVVMDASAPFVLPRQLLERALQNFEVFLVA
jgi:LmbE family N-acetylglucosaminyl deacetylase